MLSNNDDNDNMINLVNTEMAKIYKECMKIENCQNQAERESADVT